MINPQTRANNPYPIHALPINLRNVVLELAQVLQVSYEAAAVALFGVIAIPAQRDADVESRPGVRTPLAVALLSIIPASGRKSSLDNLVSKPITAYEAAEKERAALAKPEYDAKLAIWKEKQKSIKRSIEKKLKNDINTANDEAQLIELHQNKPKEPRPTRHLYQDTGMIAMLNEMHLGDRNACLYSNEAATILGSQGLNSTGHVNSLWSGDPIKVDRCSSDSFEIINARLSIVLMVQNGVFEELLDRKGASLRSSGFFARCLISEPRVFIGTRFINETEHHQYYIPLFHARIKQLLEQQSSPPKERELITFSAEARKEWVNIYNIIEQQMQLGQSMAFATDFGGRQAEHVARIAGLMSYFEYGPNTEISVDCIRAAHQIVIYHANEFLAIFPPPVNAEAQKLNDNANKLINTLTQIAQKQNSLFINTTCLMKGAPSGIRLKANLMPTLHYLASHGYLRMLLVKRTTIVELNPAFFGMSASNHGYPPWLQALLTKGPANQA